jgi:hypothetical protein
MEQGAENMFIKTTGKYISLNTVTSAWREPLLESFVLLFRILSVLTQCVHIYTLSHDVVCVIPLPVSWLDSSIIARYTLMYITSGVSQKLWGSGSGPRGAVLSPRSAVWELRCVFLSWRVGAQPVCDSALGDGYHLGSSPHSTSC